MSEKLLQSGAAAKINKRHWRLKNFPHSFVVRATGEEHKKLKASAQQTGLSMSRLVIEGTLAKSLKTSAQAAAERAETEELFFELKRIGTRLSQINSDLSAARRGTASDAELEIGRISREIEAALNKLRRKL